MRCLVNLLVVLALFAPLSTSRNIATKEDDRHHELEDLKLPSSIRGIRKGFAPYKSFRPYYQATMTCDKNLKVCRAKGSPGPNCCKKRCVEMKTDRYNCGRCGKKCKYSEICCKGKCVNPMFNRNNCGGCNIKCNRGSLCIYGMCGYA